jgi:hypothetical protein
MARWNDAWFGGESMPENSFPKELLPVAETIAEEWLFEARYHPLVEEWVPGREADAVVGGLLWNGFCLRGQPQKRVAPKPVLVRLLFTEPHPANADEVRERMREYFARAVREWIKAFEQHGSDLRIAP